MDYYRKTVEKALEDLETKQDESATKAEWYAYEHMIEAILDLLHADQIAS